MLRWLVALLPRRTEDLVQVEMRFDALLEAEPRSRERAFLRNKRGVARIAQGRVEDAVEDFEAALALDPQHVAALVNLGNVAFDANRIDEALARYERAIALDAQYARAHANIAAVYKRLGRYGDAVRALRTAQRLDGRRRLTFWRRSRPS